MPGLRQLLPTRCADLVSRVTAMLWLVTALSVLQWQAPGVDPSVFARLGTEVERSVGLAVAEHALPAVEARAATSTVVLDKRSSGGRPLSPAAPDGADLGVPPIEIPGLSATLAAAATGDPDEPRAAAGRAFAARSPPALA